MRVLGLPGLEFGGGGGAGVLGFGVGAWSLALEKAGAPLVCLGCRV